MALVEIEAGPFLVTAAITRDAVEELALAPGVKATAAVKATSVMIERALSDLVVPVVLLARDRGGSGCGGDDGGGGGRTPRRPGSSCPPPPP